MTRHTHVTPTRTALTCNVTGRHAPCHALYAKNIHSLKENPIMALKSLYEAKRGHAKKLCSDVRPGDLLYVIHDVETRVAPYEDSQLYEEYEVTNDTAPFTGHPMVCSTSPNRRGGSELSVTQLLTHHREVHGKPPRGIRNIADTPQAATNHDVAQRTHAAHQKDMSRGDGSKKILAAAGAKRSRWF
ncbi:hypothetical protein ACIGO8_08125 [Streptomyces sp. NPDC053493]|uniref:hypothetical protein n=1 Tax=Streptomyces sp. NPDC053493 TaxID=3365705 RepID=UPI0037CD9995